MDTYSKFVENLDKKMKIKFSGEKNNNDLYSGWEINRISDNFNEFYYKNELLKTLEELIKSGTKPSDIWILNKSINIKTKYIKYKTGEINFSNPNSIMHLYFLGSPTPLYTNKKIMLLSLGFEAFRSVFSICNKYTLNMPNKVSTLNGMLDDLNSEQIDTLTNYLKRIVFDTNDRIDSKLKKKLESEIKNSLENIDKNFVRLLKEPFKDNISFPKDLKKYDNFDTIFNSYERPIIIVNTNSSLNRDETELNIICSEFFVSEKFKKNNTRFLETNLISQNSPLAYVMTLSVTLLPTLVLIYRKRKELLEFKRENYGNQITDQEIIDALDRELNELDTKLNCLEEKNTMYEREYEGYKENQNFNGTSIPVINTGALEHINNNKQINLDRGMEWLKSNNLEVIEESVRIVDIE